MVNVKQTMLNALKVIALDPKISAWLRENDPKALAQVARAIDTAADPGPSGRRAEPVDTATLSDTQLFAHYKKTAPNEDAKFFLKHAQGLTPGEELMLVELATDRVRDRAEHYRTLRNIQDAWRRRSNERERAARTELKLEAAA